MSLILDNYPSELLQQIVLYLHPIELKRLTKDSVLYDLALERLFSCIYVQRNVSHAGLIEYLKDCVSIPPRLFQALFLQKKLKPKRLQFETVIDILVVNDLFPDVVANIPNLEYIGNTQLTLEEVRKLPSPERQRRLVITSGVADFNSTYELPAQLSRLKISNISFAKYPDSLRYLDVDHSGNFEFFNLPLGLKDLVIRSNQILQHLVNNLPTNLKDLQLCQARIGNPIELDLSGHTSLEYLRVISVNLSAQRYPSSLISMTYKNFSIKSLESVLNLPHLKSLELYSCWLPVSSSFEFPRTLTTLIVDDLHLSEPIPWDLPVIFDFKPPPHLQMLAFRQSKSSEILLSNNVLSHGTLHHIDLKVNGIYYDFDPLLDPCPDFTSLRCITFSPSVKSLVMKGAYFIDIEEATKNIPQCEIQRMDMNIEVCIDSRLP